MKKYLLSPVLVFLLGGNGAVYAGEEIQLAAAIGARAIEKSGQVVEAEKRPEPQVVGNALSRTAMISIGVGAAVVIGVVAGGSSTTSH